MTGVKQVIQNLRQAGYSKEAEIVQHHYDSSRCATALSRLKVVSHRYHVPLRDVAHDITSCTASFTMGYANPRDKAAFTKALKVDEHFNHVVITGDEVALRF